jgi:hypothetical protein
MATNQSTLLVSLVKFDHCEKGETVGLVTEINDIGAVCCYNTDQTPEGLRELIIFLELLSEAGMDPLKEIFPEPFELTFSDVTAFTGLLDGPFHEELKSGAAEKVRASRPRCQMQGCDKTAVMSRYPEEVRYLCMDHDEQIHGVLEPPYGFITATFASSYSITERLFLSPSFKTQVVETVNNAEVEVYKPVDGDFEV